uniref:Putative IST2-Plasma membrane protein n=1 Tax=Moniliophthora roreri TaxID=221103 RepID=A0A0W0GAX1_MONRR
MNLTSLYTKFSSLYSERGGQMMPIHVDLVISFRTTPVRTESGDIWKAAEQYRCLIRTLINAGFRAVGRRGETLGHILIFVSCPDKLLGRLRKAEREFNDRWIYAWTRGGVALGFGNAIGLDRVRQQFGESIAFYFGFLNTYTRFLAFPSLVGLVFYLYDTSYSPVYSALLVIWSITFVEWWRAKEKLLSVRFGTLGSFKVEKRRIGVDGVDPRSGKKRDKSEWRKRELKMLASVPAMVLFAVILGLVMTAMFIWEAFVTELYTGPGQKLASFAPTIVFIILVPRIVSIFHICATWFTDWEGHIHQSTHDDSLTLKTFIFTALTSYLGLALCAFVYVPFGEGIMRVVARVLDDGEGGIWSDISMENRLNPSLLKDQMFAYTVTNQIVDNFEEIGMPFITRRFNSLVSRYKSPPVAHANGESNGACHDKASRPPAVKSSPMKKVTFSEAHLHTHTPTSSEQKLISMALHELSLPPYDIFLDYREMVIQFGYVALWSIIWPLAPLMAFINNILEIRSDAFKIATHSRRPVPCRVEGIGAWLDVLGWLVWLGSITNAVLVWLFFPRDADDFATGGTCAASSLTKGPARLSAFERVHKKLFEATSPSARLDIPLLWRESARATADLLMKAFLVGLVASHTYSFMRAVIRHIVERVVWYESKEREEKETKEWGIREVFLKDLIGKDRQGEDESHDVDEQDMPDLVKDFWLYEEGGRDIKLILDDA